MHSLRMFMIQLCMIAICCIAWVHLTEWKNKCILLLYIIKTHGSESRGQEEAAVRDERMSYLHVAPP